MTNARNPNDESMTNAGMTNDEETVFRHSSIRH